MYKKKYLHNKEVYNPVIFISCYVEMHTYLMAKKLRLLKKKWVSVSVVSDIQGTGLGERGVWQETETTAHQLQPSSSQTAPAPEIYTHQVTETQKTSQGLE